jgi:transglutaminase elicitor
MTRWWKRTFTMFAASSMLAACGGQAISNDETIDNGGDVVMSDDGKLDAIGGYEAPETLVPGASRRLASNIVGADVGKTFGTDDDHVPYPDTYWPFTDEGADATWNGGDGPITKFMKLVDAAQVKAAHDWEHNNHGPAVPGVAGWWGHCPGWTGASMANAPIKHAVNAKLVNGAFAACTAGSAGCTKFEIADINALEAEVYVDGDSSFIGARCDTAPNKIKRDANGRILTSGCGGVNPGSLLIVMATQMKKNHKPFAIDAQNDYNTDQIWNQPAYRYKVNRFKALTEKQAANLVAHGTMTGAETKYPYNASAKGWALVDVTLSWVSENGPNTTMVSGMESTRETRMVAVIELDKAPANTTAKILGGEYVDDASVGADRLTVPPFLWTIQDAGADDESTSVGGDNHNPYVKPSLVKQLIALGQQ